MISKLNPMSRRRAEKLTHAFAICLAHLLDVAQHHDSDDDAEFTWALNYLGGYIDALKKEDTQWLYDDDDSRGVPGAGSPTGGQRKLPLE